MPNKPYARPGSREFAWWWAQKRRRERRNLPFLDQYSGAAAAYSLRDLAGNNPSVVRVRRSSDNTEQDFTANQINDGSLVSFVGAGDGLVTTWYDQSGSGNDATQDTASAQPKIVDGGVLVNENGKAALDFDGVNDFMVTANPVITTNTWLVEVVANVKAVSNLTTLLCQHSDGVKGRLIIFNQNPVAMFLNNGSSFTGESSYSSLTSSLFTNAAFDDDYYLSTDGQELEKVIENQPLTPVVPLMIAALDISNPNRFCECNINEIILYPSDQSANREAIESNINDYYGIY